MNILKGIAKGVGAVVKVATPIALTMVSPASLVNVVACGVLKHGVTKFDNQNIPVANMIGSTVFSYLRHAIPSQNWAGSVLPAIHEGGLLAGTGWAIHQSVKVPAKQLITDPVLAAKVGPGKEFSL